MKILPIRNNCSFRGLYKIDRTYVGDNTEQFLYDMWNNHDVATSHEAWSNDIFVLTPDDKDKEFEECIKKDNGRYCKSKPLSSLMCYPGFLKEIFRINKISNDNKENWVDYTENLQTPAKDEEDEVSF